MSSRTSTRRQLATCARVVLVLLGLVAAAPGRAHAAPTPFTLDDALARALVHQPSLAAARARIAAASSDVDLVAAERRPTVGASASYGVGVGPGGALDAPTQAAAGDVTATWRLWDFGQRAARTRAAEAAAAASQVALTAAERATLRAVELAFTEVLGARAQAEVSTSALAAEARHLDEAERLVAAGARTAIDTATARARLARARVAQLQADQAVVLAVAALAQAVGAEVPTADRFSAAYPGPVPGEDANLDALVATAVATDPELAVLAAQRRASAAAREATRRTTRPTLAASAVVGVDALGQYGAPPDDRRVAGSWSTGLTLAWTLYDGGARAARVRAADADLRLADADRASRMVALRYQVEAARLAVIAARAERVASGDNVAASDEQLRLAEARFLAGLGTSAERADAQDAVTEARGGAADADYRLAVARTSLRHALGLRLLPAPAR